VEFCAPGTMNYGGCGRRRWIVRRWRIIGRLCAEPYGGGFVRDASPYTRARVPVNGRVWSRAFMR